MLAFAALGNELPRLGNDDIIRTAAVRGHALRVMHLTPAVKAQDEIEHLFIDKIVYLVIESNAVGGDGEMNLLIMQLFKLTPVADDTPDDIEIHQRFTAEKVYLQVMPSAAVLNKKIERRLTRFKAHKHPAAAVFAGLGKAVFTSQVAVVSNVEAHALDGGKLGLAYDGLRGGGIELTERAKLVRLGKNLIYFITRIGQRIDVVAQFNCFDYIKG